ncbi:uncharacterized protein ACR2FA_012022 [Aphomia sociella]
MFKKLKDKLAEEVKSSPQRIQQFAQAAQAAVTSASSSISDITNSDLFSIGDNDIQQSRAIKAQSSSGQQNTFQDVPLIQSPSLSSAMDSSDYASTHDITENHRQRRLSNSSFASDVSFRLPSYESPSMYHLQSDMEISASEAEERGFSSSTVSLDRVTKEQLYAAYRRTQERYTKYRTQYADLARHYKQLERENAKAKSVLVETQDKALRRISELREQCALEQSAKAHLEKALRVDIEEKNMKIDALNTKVSLLQNNDQMHNNEQKDENTCKKDLSGNDVQLINLSTNDETKQTNDEEPTTETNILTKKIEKMEQLLNKYKESLKTAKEKNIQLTTELQMLSNELENKNKESEQLKSVVSQLSEAKQQIEQLHLTNEDLQNQINAYDFSKTKEVSTMELDLHKAKEEIGQLNSKIEIFSKREEEYAISLAENKLSIHKELEGKEAEIKSLKDSLSTTKTELQSVNIVVKDYKNNISLLEEKLSKSVNELTLSKNKIADMETQLQLLTQKSQSIEQTKLKADEEYKCLQLQLKQETAEKLAMIDRNVYLENRNSQLTEENTKKGAQLSRLENDIQNLKKENENNTSTFEASEKTQILDELDIWKTKYSNLESEIQEERDELVKLQSEIEKLLENHEQIQMENSELHSTVRDIKLQNVQLQEKVTANNNFKFTVVKLANEIKFIKKIMNDMTEDTKTFKNEVNNNIIPELHENINLITKFNDANITKWQELRKDYENSIEMLQEATDRNTAFADEMTVIKKENDDLKTKGIRNNETEILNLKEELQTIVNSLDVMKKENEQLSYISKQYCVDKEALETKYKNLLKEIEVSEKEQQTLAIQNSSIQHNLENEIENLKDRLQESQSQIKHFDEQQKDDLIKFNNLKQNNEKIITQLQNDFAVKEASIKKLEQKLKTESQENMSLKNQSENLAEKFKILEVEIEELRKAHDKIEAEKNNLNIVIEQLEKSQIKHTQVNQDTQTDAHTVLLGQNLVASELNVNKDNEIVPKNFATLDQENKSSEDVRKMDYEIQSLIHEVGSVNSKNVELEQEVKELKHTNVQLTNKLLEQKIDTVNIDQVENTEKYQSLHKEFDLLKEENRRLQSDVEGLQTYLTKISKENGILNDKIRELIASSESSADKNDMNSPYLTDLKNEIQQGKDKIDDLLRENSFLLEENLELKDQLQSQIYLQPNNNISQNDNDSELVVMKEKYKNVLDTKNKLEDRLLNLEQMNKSVNGNVQEMHDNNEKLRLTNEKLERQLDEALVSLRHLHSLQENTELEYLRNILYEYLTGSGTHSITLAKVLSAVVKFDDGQTQQVLQKEKERQGVLRQLGLL